MSFNDWFTKDDIKDPTLRNFRDTVIKSNPEYLQEYHSKPDPASKTNFLRYAKNNPATYYVETSRDELYERPINGGRRKNTRRKRTRRKRPRRKNYKKSKKHIYKM